MIGSAWAIGSITGVALLVGAATMVPPQNASGEHEMTPRGVDGGEADFALRTQALAAATQEALPSLLVGDSNSLPSATDGGSVFEIIHAWGTDIPPNEYCGYVVTVHTGNPEPTFEWYLNGKFNTSGELITFTSPASGSVYLEVYEYRGGVQTNYADLTLTVDNSVPSYYCDPT